MSSFLDSIANFFTGGQKLLSPIPQEQVLTNVPQFKNGKQAIPSYITKTFPGENQWMQKQEAQNPTANPSDFIKEYFNASTAPGGINYQASPTQTLTPTPTPQSPQIPNTLAQIPNDPGESYNPIIVQASKDNNIPAPLLKGVLAHESMQFNPKYVGGYHTDGSGRGVAAIDKNAHPEIPDSQAFDPKFAIPWAAKTLSGYKDQEGNWYKALQRYNGGGNYNSSAPGYAGIPIIQRTQDYANNVLQQAEHFASGLDSNINTSQTP